MLLRFYPSKLHQFAVSGIYMAIVTNEIPTSNESTTINPYLDLV